MEEFIFTFVQIFLTGCVLFVVYYLKFVVRKPHLFCHKRMQSFLKSHVPILFENFWPTFYLLDPRIQTIFKDNMTAKKNIVYTRELLTFSDGEVVALDWSQKYHVRYDHKDSDDVISDEDKKRPIVIIIPGIIGNSREMLVKKLVEQCDKHALRCVVLNFRGSAGMKLKTAKPYCATDWRDLDHAIGWINQHHPASPLMTVGCSLGGIITTNYIASDSTKNLKHLVGAMTISMAWDCVASNNSLCSGLNYYLLQKPMLGMMIKAVSRFKDNFSGVVDLDVVFQSKTTKEFDDNFTARIFGFKDAHDYYKAASCFHKVKDIKIPYLNLTSEDDPFVPFETVPTEAASKSDYVVIASVTRGGHIGFIDALWKGQKEGYYERVFVQFACAVFKAGGELKMQ